MNYYNCKIAHKNKIWTKPVRTSSTQESGHQLSISGSFKDWPTSGATGEWSQTTSTPGNRSKSVHTLKSSSRNWSLRSPRVMKKPKQLWSKFNLSAPTKGIRRDRRRSTSPTSRSCWCTTWEVVTAKPFFALINKSLPAKTCALQKWNKKCRLTIKFGVLAGFRSIWTVKQL